MQDKEIGKILIIDDDEDVLLAAKMLLKKYADEVIIEKNPKKIPFLLNEGEYDVILLDMNFRLLLAQSDLRKRSECGSYTYHCLWRC